MAQYVTPAELAQHLNMPSTPSPAQTDMLTRAIEAASAQIDGVCGRTFSAVSEVRYFTAMTPVIADVGYVSTIELLDLDTIGDLTYASPLLVTDYVITDPRGRRYIQLTSTASTTLPLQPNGIRITGIFGEVTVPPDVKMATMLQAARLWKRKDAVFGEIAGENGYMRIKDWFDMDARQLLKDGGWIAPRRMVIA